jgi:hypothetical protein
MPKLIICILITLASTQIVLGQRVRQSREVVEAFRVCRQFQTLMAEDLDFDRAFEATFTKSAARRREIAVTEGEFGDLDFSHVNNATLIDAFKSRMQIFYLLLPLASPNNNEEEDLFFPPPIKAIFERKPPASVEDFSAYAVQLKRDVADLRAHLNQLAGRYPRVAERIREFKSDLSKPIELPQHKVKPLTAYSKGRVLGLREEYYQIGDYAVIREAGQMRIVGIRFFSRLF